MKVKMFGFLKNLLGKPAQNPAVYEEMPAPEEAMTAPSPQPAATSVASFRRNLVQQRLHPQNGHGVELPLQKILSALPLELLPRVQQNEVGDMTIIVPLEKVLAQLSRGSVKIPFGELRLAAPGVFLDEDDRDRVLVPLPLADILARLNPALISCRRAQRKVEVPEDITSPFDVHGTGLVFAVGPAKPEATPAATSRNAMSAPPPRQTSLPASRPLPPSHSPDLPIRPLSLPAAKAAISTPAAPVQPPTIHIPKAAPRPGNHDAFQTAASVPHPAHASHDHQSESLIVGLTSLAEGWPEAVRKEIVELSLVDARVALPGDAIEQALKLGRIAFSWKTLRSWIKPVPLPTVSAHDSTVLELPLKVVAPLFLNRQREAARSQQKVTIDEDIPNLFFGFPQAEGGAPVVAAPASAAPIKPADTNYYVWDDSSDVVRTQDLESRRSSAETRFVVKYATPNEIVSRAAALQGVVGALIALPDGLMVANKLPPDLNADTLAAFLPQIFGKVSQCTKELRMGELNNLNFTVGNIPWKIFRVNAIFFAAFGRVGEGLPTAQLAALAAELDHKPK